MYVIINIDISLIIIYPIIRRRLGARQKKGMAKCCSAS